MNTIVANETYRRSNARELVATMLGEQHELFDVELLIDALLEADPYEREFDDIDTQGFWEIARLYSREILTGDTVMFAEGEVGWVVLATYTESVLLESPRKWQRAVYRNTRRFAGLRIVARHGRGPIA